MPKPSVAGFKKSDPYAALGETFKDKCAQSSPEELYKLLTEVEAEEQKLEAAKEDDKDLQAARVRLNTANEPYRKSKKDAKLKKRLILRVLGDKGKL